MKDALTAMATDRPLEQEDFANRKLIRPSLNRSDGHSHSAGAPERRERPARSMGGGSNSGGGSGAAAGGGRKAAPPETTNAENFYYQKQMQGKTPMVIVLRDGEIVHGVIEWYDKNCLKVNRTAEPNLVIYKPAIKYMYKEGEGK
jgi:sRNA-binding regulator protein Hfq